MTNVARFREHSMRARKTLLRSCPLPRKGERPSINLGDDPTFLSNASAHPFQASYGEVSTRYSHGKLDAALRVATILAVRIEAYGWF
jgi:hypothetical protein